MYFPPVDENINYKKEDLVKRWSEFLKDKNVDVSDYIDVLLMSPVGEGLDSVVYKEILQKGGISYATGKYKEPKYKQVTKITGQSINRFEKVMKITGQGTAGKAKDFVSAALKAFLNRYGEKPSTISQLLNFAQEDSNPVIGYIVTLKDKGNEKKVYFGDGNGSVTYRSVSRAFSDLVT